VSTEVTGNNHHHFGKDEVRSATGSKLEMREVTNQLKCQYSTQMTAKKTERQAASQNSKSSALV
jgi:hypothetical protein